MVDAILGLVIATIATSALALAVEFNEAAFARKGFLGRGLSAYERNVVLPSAGLTSVKQKESFSEFLSRIEL